MKPLSSIKFNKIDPTYLLPRYNLGLKHLILNNRDEAIKQFRELLNIEPFFEETFFTLGAPILPKGLKNAVFTYKKSCKITRECRCPVSPGRHRSKVK